VAAVPPRSISGQTLATYQANGQFKAFALIHKTKKCRVCYPREAFFSFLPDSQVIQRQFGFVGILWVVGGGGAAPHKNPFPELTLFKFSFGVAEPFQSLRFELAGPLTGDTQPPPNLAQRQRLLAFQAVAHLQDLQLPGRQSLQPLP
jgi:hypothetical protein